jgi:hypothetical protein
VAQYRQTDEHNNDGILTVRLFRVLLIACLGVFLVVGCSSMGTQGSDKITVRDR